MAHAMLHLSTESPLIIQFSSFGIEMRWLDTRAKVTKMRNVKVFRNFTWKIFRNPIVQTMKLHEEAFTPELDLNCFVLICFIAYIGWQWVILRGKREFENCRIRTKQKNLKPNEPFQYVSKTIYPIFNIQTQFMADLHLFLYKNMWKWISSNMNPSNSVYTSWFIRFESQ